MDQFNDQVRIDYGGWISGPCLPSDDQEQLWKLRVTWRDKYVVDFNGDIWSAYRVGIPQTLITGDTSGELATLLTADDWLQSRPTENGGMSL